MKFVLTYTIIITYILIICSNLSCSSYQMHYQKNTLNGKIPKKELKIVWEQTLFQQPISSLFKEGLLNEKIIFMDLPLLFNESIVLPLKEEDRFYIASMNLFTGKFQWKTEGSWAYAKLKQKTIHTKKTEHNVEAFQCIDLASGQPLWTITHKEVYPPSMRWYLETLDTVFSYTSSFPGFNIEQSNSIAAFSKQTGEKQYEHTFNQQAYLIPLILNDATLCLLFHDKLILLDIPSGEILEERPFTEKKDLSDYVNAELIDHTLYILNQNSMEAILIPQNKTLWKINFDDSQSLQNDSLSVVGAPEFIQIDDTLIFYTLDPSQIFAVDAKTGSIRWKQQNLPHSFLVKPMKHSQLPTILSVNEKGQLFGFDLSTGKTQWISSVKPARYTQIIEYENGFLIGEGNSTELYYLDASSGQLRWFVDVPFWHPIFPKLTVWGSCLGIISDEGVFYLLDLPTW